MNTRPRFAPFPRGWFHAAYSDEVPPGKAVPLRRFGKDLVLFRGEDGKAALLDAYCPHLGAHLGHGGEVEGGSIRCPFHGWRFSTDGACVEVPYGKLPAGKAAIPAWELRELNGIILLHHDPAGKAPAFELPVLERADDWLPFQRKIWTMRTNVQQPLENIFDAAHFNQLHDGPQKPTVTVSVAGHVIRCHWSAKFRGPKAMIIEGTLDWEGTGMGYGTMRIAGATDALLVCSCAPIDEDLTEMGIWFWARKDRPLEVAYAVFRDIVRLIEEDIGIWEKKIHLARPLLSDEETGIAAFRDWCGQFL